MTRPDDAVPPTLTTPVPDPDGSICAQHLVVALERLGEQDYTWDDADDEAIIWAGDAGGPPPLLSEPFDNLTAWNQAGTPTIVAGRTGTAVQFDSTADQLFYNIPTGAQSDVVIIGFAIHLAGFGSHILKINSDDGARPHIDVTAAAGGDIVVRRGGLAILGTATAALTINTWHYVECRVKMHDTAGELTVRVNGAVVLDATGLDTRNGGTKAVYDQVQLGAPVGSLARTYDDLYLDVGSTATFRGPGTIPPGFAGGGSVTTDLVWDSPAAASGFVDAVCDFHAVTIVHGPPDENEFMPTAEAVITLDNSTGAYSTRSVDGRLVYWSLGRRVQLLGVLDAGELVWLFSGRVVAWDEQTDGTVVVTAHDGFAQLAADPAGPWIPGTVDQTVAQRVASICSTVGYLDATRLQSSDVRLGNPATDRSPLDEARVSAMSDGGLLFCDADGALTYWDRTYTTGRDDQPSVPVITDNLCGAGALDVWDVATVSDDTRLASTVRLENYAEPALVATASLPASPWIRPYRFEAPELGLWRLQADGDRLAGDLLARYSNDAPRFEWAMWLHAGGERGPYWPVGLGMRLGDRVNVTRLYPAVDGDAVLDVDVLVGGIVHEINPSEWVMTVTSSRVIAWRWPELWDATPYTWDEVATRAVWSR